MGYICPAMDTPPPPILRIGDWSVDPATGQMTRGKESVRAEARALRLLLCLAESAGGVLSIDELLNKVWSGVIVTPDSVYQAVAALRRLLGDDPKNPTYIATVPRLGYRMIAPVGPWAGQHASPMVVPAGTGGLKAGGAALCLGLAVAFMFYGRGVNHQRTAAITGAPQRSVAVLPFLDLTTQEMNEEYFADGMTEELIGRLSKIPGLRVPAVAVRLIRADDGHVVWSETYDRPLNDKLKVQDDIAGEVAKALRATIR
jgi:transcriptional activator of cad operon